MPKFIHVTDTDGVEYLVNTDFVCVTKGAGDTVIIATKTGSITTKSYSFKSLENLLCKEDSVLDRIADNLFHIWEILRARLH